MIVLLNRQGLRDTLQLEFASYKKLRALELLFAVKQLKKTRAHLIRYHNRQQEILRWLW